MADKPYYMAYEERYRAAYAAGAERWGHAPDDAELTRTLDAWVRENALAGATVVEYACGEGACGVILSRLGCRYRGFDIAPSAVGRAREALADFPDAEVGLLDMTRGSAGEGYDAALDCMGLHMLVVDADRRAYLENARRSLKPGGAMLFFRESYRREGAYGGDVGSFDEWLRVTGDDYATPSPRRAFSRGGEVEVAVPLVPARARDRDGYERELRGAGFAVERFVEMAPSRSIACSASVYARRL